jgi:hypothetical protein
MVMGIFIHLHRKLYLGRGNKYRYKDYVRSSADIIFGALSISADSWIPCLIAFSLIRVKLFPSNSCRLVMTLIQVLSS